MTHIEELRQRIDEAATSYYNKGVAIVSDDEFDTMLNMLRRLDHKDPRLTQVGAEATLDKVEHDYPMGSLDNIDVNKPSDLANYIKRNHEGCSIDCLYHVTPKIDGSSVAATYDAQGKLIRLVTRGNGYIGQDITAKAPYIKNMPMQLPVKQAVTVRGEVVMYRETFIDYIKVAKLEGVRNPRNVGNGILVRSECLGAGLLNFHAFNIIAEGNQDLTTIKDSYDFLRSLGFDPPPYEIVAADGIDALVKSMIQCPYPYDVDGLVIRVNDLTHQKLINEGGDELRPRSDRAIKFNSKKAETVVLGVTVTVGSTGKITPTLAVEPVEIGGIVNSNVLIYNYDEPERLKVGVGDKIRVVLAGDIIPKVMCVVDKADPPTVITAPTHCPVCNQPVGKKKLLKGESVDIFCFNQKCPGIQFEKIKGFIGSSKRGMGILGIGEHLIRHLVDSGRVNDISDLYTLTSEELRVMPLGNGVVGAKRAKTIVDNIQESRTASVPKIVGSLGIDGMGEHRAELTIEAATNTDGFPSLETFDDWADLAKIDNPFTAINHPHLPQSIMVEIHRQLAEMREVLDKLRSFFVPQEPVVRESIDSPKPFAGKTFCFTGTRQYTDLVEKLGGTIKSGVSKTLDYLVQKDPSEMTSKAKKAQAYGTTVIGVPELENLINEADPDLIKSDEQKFEDILTDNFDV